MAGQQHRRLPPWAPKAQRTCSKNSWLVEPASAWRSSGHGDPGEVALAVALPGDLVGLARARRTPRARCRRLPTRGGGSPRFFRYAATARGVSRTSRAFASVAVGTSRVRSRWLPPEWQESKNIVRLTPSGSRSQISPRSSSMSRLPPREVDRADRLVDQRGVALELRLLVVVEVLDRRAVPGVLQREHVACAAGHDEVLDHLDHPLAGGLPVGRAGRPRSRPARRLPSRPRRRRRSPRAGTAPGRRRCRCTARADVPSRRCGWRSLARLDVGERLLLASATGRSSARPRAARSRTRRPGPSLSRIRRARLFIVAALLSKPPWLVDGGAREGPAADGLRPHHLALGRRIPGARRGRRGRRRGVRTPGDRGSPPAARPRGTARIR